MDNNSAENKSHFISNNYFSERSENKVDAENEHNQGVLGGEVLSDLGFGNLAAAKEYAEKYEQFNLEDEAESENINEE